MKRKSTALLLSLLLLPALCVPALAAIEYGVFYDETEQLGSVELSYAAEQTLPRLTQELGVDLRVDAFTDEDVDADTSAADIAAYVYENSGYGCGEWKEGVSLTLLLRGTENGAYTLSETDWCVYAFLDEARGSAQELSDAVYNAVKPYMVERAWNGEDMNMSATALSQAVNAMAESVEDYIRENASPDVTGGADAPDETETSPPEITEILEPDTSSMRYIFDLAGCLSSDSRTKLEARAEEISTRHSCGVYVAFVDDYKVYSQGGDVYEGTYRFYHDKQLGMGDGRDGVIVLLSMQNRKYAMFIYGENAAYAINEYGAEQLEGRFLGQFSDGNWYIGAAEYLTACDEYLSLAEAGKPVRESPWAVIAIVVIVSCLIASGVCKVLKMNMKTVRRGAAAYLGLREKGDQTELTDWLRENCADLTSELPFLLEIPSERVLGAGYGKLFCIVPRDENTSLAVNHVTWQMMGNGLHPVTDEVLYREEYAEPVLVFVDPEEPDKEVNLVTNDGVAAIWYPQEDGYGNLFLPTDEDGAPLLYDFAIYGYTTGLDYPEGWEPSGDDW